MKIDDDMDRHEMAAMLHDIADRLEGGEDLDFFLQVADHEEGVTWQVMTQPPQMVH